MPTSEALPSSSGARLTGDDVQHAVAWHAALRAVVAHSGIRSVTVEALEAGNVDDVVIRKVVDPDEYIQVKATVTAQHPASIGWLTEPTRSGGPSILQRFHRTFLDLHRNGKPPQLTLVTNRSIDPKDPILTQRDRNDRLAQRVRHSTQAATIAAREEIIKHLGCTEAELYELLENLRICTDASEAAWRDRIRDISFAAGVRSDETAFRVGLGEVREWVKNDRIERRAADITQAIDRLQIRAQDPCTVLAIKALDEELILPDASVTLDWVSRFRGTEARNRRGLKDPHEWETVLRPELLQAQRILRSLGAHRILITGTMRLPTWFTAGVVFQESAGFIPAKFKEGRLWVKPSVAIAPAQITTSIPVGNLTPNADVALALAISCDLTADVQRHLAGTGIPIMTVSLPAGVSNASITDCNHAYGVALAIRDLAREISRTINPPTLHLFMAIPVALAVMLGGLWDRVPTTQTYEDLGGNGYEPAFMIPN